MDQAHNLLSISFIVRIFADSDRKLCVRLTIKNSSIMGLSPISSLSLY